MQFYDDLCFVPLTPRLETGSVLVWKKNQMMGELLNSSSIISEILYRHFC